MKGKTMPRKKVKVTGKKVNKLEQDRKKLKLALLYIAGGHSTKVYEVVQKIFASPSVDDFQVVSNDNGVNLILKENL